MTIATSPVILAAFGCEQAAAQQMSAELARAARILVLGELTASIAHEINQPLTAIAIHAEAALRWLDRTEPAVIKARESMQHIVADVHRTADIISRIRGMIAPRSPTRTPLSPRQVIDEAIRFLGHEIQSNDIALSLDVAPALPRVVGDRIQLHQVITNLALNAIEAMRHARTTNGLLAIRATLSDPDTVTCAIEDNGPGIEPKYLDRIFDSFFTTKDTGTGLGLSISRGIIEAHGGRLRAENLSGHGGARFSFTLPAVVRDHEPCCERRQ